MACKCKSLLLLQGVKKYFDLFCHWLSQFYHVGPTSPFKYGEYKQTKPILNVNPVGCFINNSRADTSSALPVIPPLQHHFNQPHLICLLSAASQQHLWKRFYSTEKLMHKNKDTVFLLTSITQRVSAQQLSQTLYRQLIARNCDAFNTFKKK